MPLDVKLKLVREYSTLLLKRHRKITSTHVAYVDSMRTVYFANSRGSFFLEERPKVVCRFSATAREASLIQTAGDGISSVTTYNAVTDLEEKVTEAADRAVALLSAPKCPGGPQVVILNPRFGGVFAHEAFGHLSEADFLYENENMKDIMTVGKKMGAENLDIIDEGSMKGTGGSLTFDDEGTPAQKTYLIRGGVLTGHLHSLETAAKMDEHPTGNARAVGRNFPPIVRMTNTYIGNGTEKVSELFKGVDKGIYACDMYGGSTMMEMFTFSAGYGYLIENGKISYLLRDIVLTGNVFETLSNIDGIADDLTIEGTGGGCGKRSQYPLPVGLGAPHLRIRNVIIGGETDGQ